MNIFVLDADPVRAAQAQHNKHVVKMVLETAQLLCGGLSGAPYKPTHLKHPCSLWVRNSRSNYLWTVEHGFALAAEYTHRYGKIHACAAVIEHCAARANEISAGALTPHAQAMPDEYRVPDDAVAAYRAYYRGAKAEGAAWTNRARPEWL